MKVKGKHNSEHYIWGDKCDSWVMSDNEELSVKMESMPAGTKEKLHFHTIARQFFFIIKGTATFYIENVKQVVNKQQGINIEPGSRHFISNESESRIEFLVVSQPTTNNDRTVL